MIIQIPTQPVPSQNLQIVLNGQQCTISLYTRDTSDQNNNITELWVKSGGIITTLGINPIDSTDVLLIKTRATPIGIFNNVYCDLTVNGVPVYTGMRITYGSVINQYPTPLFNGYLYMNTADGLDPVYTNFGTTTTLNYTDGVLTVT